MGLSKNWQTQYIRLFGETWTYRDALESKAWEGHIESGLQLILQTYVQHQTLWPSMKSLRGEMTKAYYFKSTKPGIFNIFLGVTCSFLALHSFLFFRMVLLWNKVYSFPTSGKLKCSSQFCYFGVDKHFMALS